MNAVSSVTKSMAATPQLSSRAPQREDCTGSADSVTTPNSVPTVSPVSPEPVSPGQVAEPPGKNLWEQICEEYEAELPSFPEGYIIKHENPVIVSLLEELISHDFNTEQYFPASQFITASNIPCPQNKSETVDPKTCSPREYLETFIFPVLLPGMASLLHQAKQEKCFEPALGSLPAEASSGPLPAAPFVLQSAPKPLPVRSPRLLLGFYFRASTWLLLPPRGGTGIYTGTVSNHVKVSKAS
ncbi:IQ domain-containing protein K isoform X9 [Cavia porcellus]|uniref:IQ domain-containing protein K isoform X9 n=1 Tax=Cavia porcellus TaxID=10141 RepID=UPI002FE29DE6